MKKYSSFVLLLVLSLLVFSCKRKEKTRWDIDATVPIAYGKVSVSNLIPDSLIQTDEDGILHFVLNENLTDFDMDSLVTIPDTSFLDYYPSYIGFPVDSGNSVFLVPIGLKESPMNIPTAELVEVVAKSGSIDYELKNFLSSEIKASYELPLVTLNGQTIYIEEILPAGSPSNPSVVIGSFDLTNFHFDLTGLDGDNNNIMVSDIIVTANEDLIVPTQDTIFKAIMSFTNAKVGYARGYFGQHTFDINDTIDFSALNNVIAGDLGIGDIDVNLKVENFVGIDGQINFESLTAVNTIETTEVSLDNPDLTNTINLTRAYDNNGTISSTLFELGLDEENSNIDQFIEVLPNQMRTNIGININPLGDISLGNDFIYTDKPLQANLEIDLPLCVSMDNLTLLDTLDINSNTEIEADGVLTFYIKNSFPFSANMTATLLDENGNEVELLLDNELVEGDYDITTYEITGEESTFTVQFDKEVLSYIKTDAKIALRLKLNSFGNNEVKFTPANSMDIKVVLQATTEISYD